MSLCRFEVLFGLLFFSGWVWAHNDQERTELAFPGYQFESNYVSVLGSNVHYIDTGGSKPTLVLIHGQPTWSYLWRNVIPVLQSQYRVIALDLIGFGKSDHPNIGYSPFDQIAYFAAFMEGLSLKDVVLVMHDWGGFIGMSYAERNRKNIKGLVFFESILPEDNSVELMGAELASAKGFTDFLNQMKDSEFAKKLTYEENFFVEKFLITSIDASGDVAKMYREPFINHVNRKSILGLVSAFPIAGANRDTAAVLNQYGQYLAASPTPKLFIKALPGGVVNQRHIKWAKNNMTNLTVIDIGEGGHFIPESSPVKLGKVIGSWLANLKSP